MQLIFYFDQSRCSGCLACVVACKDWHNISAGPVFWRRVKTIEQGQYPRISVHFLSSACYHCAEPACMPACPAGAITKRESHGIVVVDGEDCLGIEHCGGACREACPYGAPQFGVEVNAKMQKCNMCLDRWAQGKKPICVQGCPMRALDAGPLDELVSKYGTNNEIIGFDFNEAVKPSIVFKANSGSLSKFIGDIWKRKEEWQKGQGREQHRIRKGD